jgi:ATP-dependent DNA helicase RecQ
MTPQEILINTFGYQHFYGEQENIIEHILAGGNALVLMPTGGGKSLCYQIPALIRPGLAIVISPLISLMIDQVNALLKIGIRAACLNSNLTSQQTNEVLQQIHQGPLDLLYVAPEKLTTPHFLELLNTLSIALFAIDEAHCISQWGHHFRQEYTQLSIIPQQFPTIPRIALTATAFDKTRQDIIHYLGLETAKIFVTGFDRPNIHYRVIPKKNVRRQLLDFIESEHQGETGIIYCLSRHKVEEITVWLEHQNLTVLPYHAGLDNEVRKRNQKRFLSEEGIIMVVTIAFGMGIDKPNVRFVAHLDLPKSLETYYQETGRAGRDGLPASAWMAYGLPDIVTLQKLLNHSNTNEQYQQIEQQRLESIIGYCEMTTCRRQALLAYFGEHLPEPCGHCDTCLEPVATYDGTEVAQKALSCVYRTGQQFGIHHLINVLLGKLSEHIKQFEHHNVSTFSIGKELNAEQWHSVFRQLIVKKLVTIEEYGGLQLTENARPVLRGEQRLHLRKELDYQKNTLKNSYGREIPEKKRELNHKSNRSWRISFKGFDKLLFEALRNKRLELALAQHIDSYQIFHESTLQEMIQKRPETLEELAQIPGIGTRQLENYGQIFLNVLHGNALQYNDTLIKAITPVNSENTMLSESAQITFEAFQKGQNPFEIAQQRQLNLSTIYFHLSQVIEQGKLELRQVIKLKEEEIHEIEDKLLEKSTEEQQTLKPVFEAFEGMYDYGTLRCVRANLWRQIRGLPLMKKKATE